MHCPGVQAAKTCCRFRDARHLGWPRWTHVPLFSYWGKSCIRCESVQTVTVLCYVL